MARTIGYSNYHYELDFTKKKAVERLNGAKIQMDKMGLACWLDQIKYRCFAMSRQDCYKYAELKAMLLKELEEKQYTNVTIIK